MNTKWMTVEKSIDPENTVSYTLINLDTIFRVRVFRGGQVELVLVNGKVINLSGKDADRFIWGYLPNIIDEVPATLGSGYLGP